jgi:hypothetical protein
MSGITKEELEAIRKREYTKEEMEAIRKPTGTTVSVEGEDIVYLPYRKVKGFPPPYSFKPYTCADLGRHFGVHPDTVYKWFENYPGTIKQTHPAKRVKDQKTGEWKIKQKHTVLLIPVHVFEKWMKEHQNR